MLPTKGPHYGTLAASAGLGGSSYRAHSKAALSPLISGSPMLTSKTCREHASKCIETAKTLPPRATRNVFGYGYIMGRHCRSD